MKTKIVKTDKGYIPCVWRPNFLWGGVWYVLCELKDNCFYLMDSQNYWKYALPSSEEAEELLDKYTVYKQDRDKING